MGAPEALAYRDGATRLTGYLYRPRGRPNAAVAVYPTIMNPTPAVAAKAAALADAGYLALVCDFYGEDIADLATAWSRAEALRSDVDLWRQRLRAGLAALVDHPDADGLTTLAIGFCMGGMAVLELARDGADLAAVASFHGLLETARPADRPIRSRLLICHGDADKLVPRSQVTAFWEEMDGVGADWHFHSYSGVGHGFTNPNPPPSGGPPAYDASADRQSWAAMHALFDEVLGGQGA